MRHAGLYMAWVWNPFLSRCTDFGAGVLVYLWISQPKKGGSSETEAQPRGKRGYQLAFALAVLIAVVLVATVPPMVPEPNPTITLGVRITRVVITLSILAPFAVCAVILYVVVRPDYNSRVVAKALSSWRWNYFADRSYAVSLVHIDAGFLVFKFVPVVRLTGGLDSGPALLFYSACMYASSLIAASILDAALKPLMRSTSQAVKLKPG